MKKKAPYGLTIGAVIQCLYKNPYKHIVKKWNWKTAILSALVRGSVILSVLLFSGVSSAVSGMAIEMLYRGMTSGFFSSIIQSFRFVRPYWAANTMTMILIPIAADILDVLIQWFCGTEQLKYAITASMMLTGISVFIELHAMRCGILVVGCSSSSLAQDLKRATQLLLSLWEESAAPIRVLLRQIQKYPAGIVK